MILFLKGKGQKGLGSLPVPVWDRAGMDTGSFPGNPPPILFCLDKRECAAAGGRENRFDERAAHTGRPFVITGVVRIGPADIDDPVVPAPYPGAERTLYPHNNCGG